MARTKIDDLAQDAEELGTDEQKQVKGGAVPVVNATTVAVGAVAGGAVASAAILTGLAAGTQLLRKTAIPSAAAGGGELSSPNENPLYDNAQIADENLFKKPGS